MKTLIIFLLLTTTAFASPYLISDPSTQAVGGKFEIQENGVTIFLQDNEPDGSVKADLAGVAIGNHAYRVRYVVTDPLWGTAYSAYAPFDFSRPSLVVGPLKGLKLAP